MKKYTERGRKRLIVTRIQYIPTPDADGRLSRALGILLRSAAKNTATSEDGVNAQKEEPTGQVPTKDTFTSGDEDSDRQGS